MNNKELLELFIEIEKNNNCFDRFLALKKKSKEYKKSLFYKQTRVSIFKAYRIYQANVFSGLSAIMNNPVVYDLARGDMLLLRLQLENFLADFDTTKLDTIMDYIEDKINSLNLDNINVTTKLEQVMKEFKNSLQ